jgi:hypothetical protein
MSELVWKDAENQELKNRRVGGILALVALLYIGLVIAFIIVY